VRCRSGEHLQCLIEARASLNEADICGRTALIFAVFSGSVGTAARLLLEKKIRADAVTTNLDTALHAAVRACVPAMVRLLLDHGANVNLANKLGETPICSAVRLHDSTIAEMLIAAVRPTSRSLQSADWLFPVEVTPTVIFPNLRPQTIDNLLSDNS
jgi:ankyrin repeat protein